MYVWVKFRGRMIPERLDANVAGLGITVEIEHQRIDAMMDLCHHIQEILLHRDPSFTLRHAEIIHPFPEPRAVRPLPYLAPRPSGTDGYKHLHPVSRRYLTGGGDRGAVKGVADLPRVHIDPARDPDSLAL